MSIQSEINRISGAKSDIADAIEDQGVTVPSGTKLDGMANLIGQISGGSGKLNSTQAADAYDPTATYAVGDKVSYAGNVYSCISAISTPEAWDSTHWDQVDPIQDQVDEVRNTLNHLEDGLAIIVDGDTCTTAVPVGGYAYIKNNTHGLTEGLYTNTSQSAFPTSGGTANSSVFTSVSGGIGSGILSLINSSIKSTAYYVEDSSAVFTHSFQDDHMFLVLVTRLQQPAPTWCGAYYGIANIMASNIVTIQEAQSASFSMSISGTTLTINAGRYTRAVVLEFPI